MISVLFFGKMADITGQRRLSVEAGHHLRLWGLREQYLSGVDGVRMSVNREMVHEDQELRDGDEVAFFSVFSGG